MWHEPDSIEGKSDLMYQKIPPKTYFSTMCETEAVCWSFNKVGRQADTLTYCGMRPDSIEAKSNQIWFIRDKSNPIGFRVRGHVFDPFAGCIWQEMVAEARVSPILMKFLKDAVHISLDKTLYLYKGLGG